MKTTKPEQLQIERGIAIPPARGIGLSAILKKLKVGESVFVKNKSTPQLSGIIAYIKRQTDLQFTARTVEGGTRIWRLDDKE